MADTGLSSVLPRGSWRTLALAIALGAVGIILMTVYIRSRDRKKVMVTVALATKAMAEGDTIKHGMLVAKEVPKDAIGGKFVSGNDIIAVEGRVVGVDMDPGQPLYWNAIPLAAQGGYDRYLRPENRERAFSLAVSGPPVRPGDVIDILGTYARGTSRQAFEVLPAVTVIDHVGRGLILSVTQEEELLLLAAQPCNLTYSIRSKLEPSDDTKLDPVDLTNVLPRARQLGTARTARLRAEYPADGSIRRD